jgi:hypothetical protein
VKNIIIVHKIYIVCTNCCHFSDLYAKHLEVYNGLYQLVGWESLSKPEDFRYEEFVLRVQNISKLPGNSVELQVLAA